MALFKSKDERKQEQIERQEKLFKEFLENKNLSGLSEEDKEFSGAIGEELENVTRYTIRGSEGEITQAELEMVLIEQNWLIIKLLNDINNKLDK